MQRRDIAPLTCRTPPAAFCAAVLILLTLFMAAARLHTYDEPLEMDAATYAIVARELRAGKLLYSEVWDNKPPAIFASFYFVGSGPARIYSLGLFLATVTLVGVFLAAAEAAGTLAGLCAAAFWALAATDLNLQANQPNTEAFINAYLIWAFVLLLRMPSNEPAFWRAASIGMLIGLASLYKHVALSALGLMAAHVVTAGFNRRSLSHAAIAAGVAAMLWISVASYFACLDRFSDFMGAVFEFNRERSGSLTGNLAAGLKGDLLLPALARPFWALIAAGAFGIAFPRGTASARSRILLFTFGLTTLIAVALPGLFFPHYYQLWLPVLCVSAACGIAGLGELTQRRWVAPAAGVGLVALLALVELQALALPADEWAERKFGHRLLLSRSTAQLIAELVPPGETFLQWGHRAELYYYADRRPAGGELRTRYLLNGPQEVERAQRLLAALQANPPELIVLVKGYDFPERHPVPQWILAHYEKLAAQPCDREVADRHVFLGRRGGRLDGLPHLPCLSGAL